MNTRDRRKEHPASPAAPGLGASMSFPTAPHPFHPGCFLQASMSPLLVPGYCSGTYPYYQPCIISQQDGRRILIRQPVLHPFLRPSFGHPFNPSPSLLPYPHHMQTMPAASMYTRATAISKEVQTDTEDLDMGKPGEELLYGAVVQKESSAVGRHSGKVAAVVNFMSNLTAQENHKQSSGFCSLPASTESSDEYSKGSQKATIDQLAHSTPPRQTKKPLPQRDVDPFYKESLEISGRVEEMRAEDKDVSVNGGGYSEEEEKARLTCKKVEQVLARITDPLNEGSFEVWTIEATVPVYDAKSASDAQFDIPHCEVLSVETCKGFVAMMDSVPVNASLTCQQVLGKLTSKDIWVVDSSSLSSSEEQQGPLSTKMSDKQKCEKLHKQRVQDVWEGDAEQLRLAATIHQTGSTKDDRIGVPEMHSCPLHRCDACLCAESFKKPLDFEEVMKGSCPNTHDNCDVATEMSCGNGEESFPLKLPRKSGTENGAWLEKVDMPNIGGAMHPGTQESTSVMPMSLESSSENHVFETIPIRRQASSGQSFNFVSPRAILGSEFVQSHASLHEVNPGNSKSYSEYQKPLITGIECKTASPGTYMTKEHPQHLISRDVKNRRLCRQNAERYKRDIDELSDSSMCTSVSQVPCHKNDLVRESFTQLKHISPLDVGSLKENRSLQPLKMRTKQKRDSMQLGAVPKKTPRKMCEPAVRNVHKYQGTDSSDSKHGWYDSTVSQSDKQKERGNHAQEWLEQVANGRARSTRRRYCSFCGSLKLLHRDGKAGECEHLLTRPSWERKSSGGVRRSLYQQSIPRIPHHTAGRTQRPYKRTVFHHCESPSRIEVELRSRDARRMYTRCSCIQNTSICRNASKNML